MSAGYIALAVILSGIAGSLTDWLFYGVMFHKKYGDTPQTWRMEAGKSEGKNITISTLLGFVICGVFIATCLLYGIREHHKVFHLALLIWLMVPVPLVIVNSIYIRMNRLLIISHSLAWLVRLAVTALIFVWLSH